MLVLYFLKNLISAVEGFFDAEKFDATIQPSNL